MTFDLLKWLRLRSTRPCVVCGHDMDSSNLQRGEPESIEAVTYEINQMVEAITSVSGRNHYEGAL